MTKLSIIIPVYNTEAYIKKCLDSIVNQKLQNLEIIIVNDGSTDNSEKIIKEYLNKHNDMNIKYLKKENGGLSDARNYGLKYATGKYISFVDSDDYIDENLYYNLEKYMHKDVDLIKFKMKTVDNTGNTIEKLNGPIFEICTGEEAFEKMCVQDKFLEVACIYLYRREFFINNNFKYTKGTYHEDFGLTPLVIIQAKSVVSTNEYGYNYLQRDNSIMRNSDYEKDVKKANDVLLHYDNAIKIIDNINISKNSKELIKRYYTNTVILKSKELKDNNFKNYISEIKKRHLYKNIKPYNLKQLIKRIILKFNVRLYLKIR